MSTGIEWTDETWNPVTGCTKVSQGCKHCYAERLWPKVSAAEAKREGTNPRPFTEVRFHRDRIQTPLNWRRPRRVFVNSMSDLFHESVTWETLDILFAVMALCQGRHTFQILTKRPRRMRDYFGGLPNSPAHGLHHRVARRFAELARNDDVSGFAFPLPNVWLGVSVEDQATADERIPLLLKTPAAVRFISAEPLLGAIDLTAINAEAAGWPECFTNAEARGRLNALTGWCYIEDLVEDGTWEDCLGTDVAAHGNSKRQHAAIDWVIAGGESGPEARPAHPDWFRSVRDQCMDAEVAYFFKQWGEWAPLDTYRTYKRIPKHIWLKHDGGLIEGEERRLAEFHHAIDEIDPRAAALYHLGKSTAGRTLDGRTHDAYPAEEDGERGMQRE